MKQYRMPGIWVFVLTAHILFCIVSIPMALSWLKTPSDAIFAGVHGTPIDYYHYLGTIREGMNGSWMVSDLYNTDEHVRSLVFEYFIVIGKIGNLFHLSAIATYHLFRIIGFEFMIIMIYALSKLIVGKRYAFWAATAGLLATVPPIMYLPQFQSMMPTITWWDVLDPLHRVDYVPHHTYGTALLLLSIWSCIRFMRVRRYKYIGIASISIFIATIIYPITGFFFCLLIGMTSVGYVCVHAIRSHTWVLKTVLPFTAVILSAVCALLIMKYEVSKGFPWNGYNQSYGVWLAIPNFERNFFFAGGIVFLLSIPTIVRYSCSTEFENILLAVWAIVPVILIYFVGMFGLEKIRMAYLGQFVAYGILTVITLLSLYKRFLHIVGIKLFIFLLYFLIVVNATLTISYYLQGRLRHEVYTGNHFHIPKSLIHAYDFMNTHAPKYSNVLCDFIVCNTLPGFATIKSYFGNWTQTSDYWNKEQIAMSILSGMYSAQEVQKVLSNAHINYILVYTISQRNAIDEYSRELSISPIYTDGIVRIYKVL